jgi:MFS family permease
VFALTMLPEVLRLRDFRLVFLAQVISTIGDFFVPVAIGFAVLDLTGSASELGLVLIARLLPMVLFLLAGGVWADRLQRTHVMVGAPTPSRHNSCPRGNCRRRTAC